MDKPEATKKPKPWGYKSKQTDKASLGWKEHFGPVGSAREHVVYMPDGFILSCGIDGFSEERARRLVDAINAQI
jgi:hypothetical protein